jgi:uncharacterized protein (TIGR02677 family)
MPGHPTSCRRAHAVPHLTSSSSSLFRHVSAEKAVLYRAVMESFAAAKRQFRLHLRPDEIRQEAPWPAAAPSLEELNALLDALVDWGNLEAQPDTARVSTLEDFYRRRLLYRLTSGGEAVETGLAAFAEALAQRAELQSVALDDILGRLGALTKLAGESPLDPAKVHEALRDLVHVFANLAENAEAFMAGLARTIELQRAEHGAVMAFKARLIDYLERFIGDLVTKSSRISELLRALAPQADALLTVVAMREARDAAPGDPKSEVDAQARRLLAWRERWSGLLRWFVADAHQPPQAELLRASARAAIPRLLQAVATLNERRAGRSDRGADFRHLAHWFAACQDDREAHRLWRAAFAASPARHLALTGAEEVPSTTPWRDSPPITIHPRLRETGRLATSGGPPKIRDRSAERAQLAARLGEESAQTEAARRRLATGRETRLSELGHLDRHSFRLFLSLLGDALAAQTHPERAVECTTGDGSLRIRLEPLAADSEATIPTELGAFRGRDHRILIQRRDELSG